MVEILVSEEAGIRYLHFSSDWVQGAMRIARPFALELDYTKEMMASLLLRPEANWPRKALLIGLGAASLTKFLHRHRPNSKLTVVEIELAVVSAARQHFKLPEEDQRLNIVIGDGADYVAGCKKRFDLIMVDGFDDKARTGMLETAPFYANCRALLTEQGLLATNLLSRSRNVMRSVERLTEAFDGRALAFPSCDSGNTVAFAATGDTIDFRLAELRASARTLNKATGLNLLPTVTRLEGWHACMGGRLVL
ncbi:MAG: fused MFS/spermidine synthase [Gammaproteobacteria bacterium]|nr:fused MFS/spermidine synthase [Gammaproteobacteria bacterium]MBU1414028.1 fused MFS/spermidine synthase [Gammaproteobacteria bacterium]